MNRWIALMRGINVSGRNLIKMAELRKVCESMGFVNVQTYIQSGNIVFTAEARDAALLARNLEQAIEKYFNLTVPVFCLNPHALNIALEKWPFDDVDLAHEGARSVLVFLSGEPETEDAVIPGELMQSGERTVLDGTVLYAHYPDGLGRSKLTLAAIEKQLKVSGTARNWNTLQKISALC